MAIVKVLRWKDALGLILLLCLLLDIVLSFPIGKVRTKRGEKEKKENLFL